MNCPHCSAVNPDGASTCVECRQHLDGEMTMIGQSGVVPPEIPAEGTIVIPAGTKTPVRPPPPPPPPPRPTDSSLGTAPSLADWAKLSKSFGAMSGTLPEGMEIGKRYRVAKLLGRGGMGSVYRVHDNDLDRDVALKLIRADIAEDPETLARFKREIQLSSKVTHRNVLRVYDLGESDGIKFLTMQLVAGEDLSAVIKAGKLPNERLIRIFRQICEGLEAAHEQNVIHRDLKPQNVMLGAEDIVYLMDFGLAKGQEHSAMTQTGAMIGTPYYMAPEQVQGKETDRRSDIFSLGVILYQMATGTLPYTGGTPYQIMLARTQRPPRPASELNPELPPFLSRILERCLQINPSLRYQSVAEILTDLDAESFRSSIRYEAMRRRWVRPAAAAAVGILLLAGGAWWLWRRAPRAARSSAAPVAVRSVLISDFENKTGEPVFDGTLEHAFGLSLEGASFISNYSRASARRVAAQLQPGATALHQPLAQLVAVREGVSVVAGGSIEKKGDGYEVSVRAVESTSGKPIVAESETASDKDRVLKVVADLAAKVRGALGDQTPASVQLAAAETFTAGSLEAAHEYSVAQDLQWAGNWDEAIRHYRKALDLDPNLGRAYAGIAAVESNRGRRAEAEKSYKEAFARIDRMSDREKYRTRGGYYLLTRNPDNAIEEFSALVRQYPADTAGVANLAVAYFFKRDMPRALVEARKAVELSPRNVPQRNNLGLDAMYAGDFATAIKTQDEVLALNPKFVVAYVSKAMSQLAMGRPEEAAETYRKAAGVDARGASFSIAGLADIAAYQGRHADALASLLQGVEADVANNDPEAAAVKLLAAAEARLTVPDVNAAAADADRAVSLARGENILYPAARIYLAAGREPKAIALATELAGRLEPDPQAYAELIRGEADLSRGKTADAIRRFTAAKKIADTWAGRLDLGRAYLEAGKFAEADTEFEACVKRKGEATALFLDESPTVRLLPTADYYLGRAREGLKSPGAADAYKSFLAVKTGKGDALVADAKRRLQLK
ncbi:MAG TPA: protein kinase [Thermoanaerobaculia bacterium]|nr:protein kinase [Thermoanaerobaculia bacterium]